MEKKNTNFIIAIVVLSVCVLGLTGYIVLDKTLRAKPSNPIEHKEKNGEQNQTPNEDNKEENGQQDTTPDENNTEENEPEDQTLKEKYEVELFVDNDFGLIQDKTTGDLFVKDLSRFKVGKLKNKKIISAIKKQSEEPGAVEYIVLTNEGKVYNFVAYADLNMEDSNEKMEDYIEEISKDYYVDALKYYESFEQYSFLIGNGILYYSGDKVYENDDEFDVNNYLVYEGEISGYSNQSLKYNGVTIKDQDTQEEIKYKYILPYVDFEMGIDSTQTIDYLKYFIISDDDKLYKVDNPGEYLKSIAKIIDYKYENSFINENDYRIECKKSYCNNMTITLDDERRVNFIGGW